MRGPAKRAAILLAVCLAPLLALAQEAPGASYQGDQFSHLPRLLWDDTVTLAQAPGDWTARQWSEAGLGLGAVVATGLALDRTLDQAVVRNRRPSWDTTARDVAQLGGTGGLILIGGGYLGSSLLGKDEARSLWTDAGIAVVLAQVAILPVKYAVGRVRPGADQGTHDFQPLTSADSFPSGHATQAFAMASVISLHADSPWVSAASYGVAGLVGLSRMETRDHFSSDVLAGALVGTTLGHAVVRIDQARRDRPGPRAELTFEPAWTPEFRGIRMVAKF